MAKFIKIKTNLARLTQTQALAPIMTNHQANQQHVQAENARELQDYQVSLELAIDSEFSYDEAGDEIGFSEVQASKALTYHQLFTASKNGHFLVLAKHAALAAVEIAKNSGIKEALAIPVFNLAKIYEEVGELEEAQKLYEEALVQINDHPPVHQNRPAVKLDFRIHWLLCRIRLGEITLADEVVKAINELERSAAESDYNRKVWAAGAYLRLAEILKDFSYLEEARKIIESDERLGLRNLEWQELVDELE